ncbi:hypothetical protein LJG69_17770 [Pseudomonas aeruginosa]|uniref:hypothetical protein n=1 Tax=Pseudomonas aeruginosa TaxID=287 RepID=UPI001D0B5982|nr:hypothetical protein [Pseudomonas aeruginosa]MCC0301084.1 hypothetical protein [Pseudomonas aeruginosa]MCC0408483.1 hypothetical protein [Pseudomonas aeruginosa]MCC0433625.1 hypothetical protein [Pseudomonas aeruginosa]
MSSRELPGNVNDAKPAIEQQYPLPVTPTFAYPEVPAQDQLLDLLNLESAHIPYPHQSIRCYRPTRVAAQLRRITFHGIGLNRPGIRIPQPCYRVSLISVPGAV